MNPEEGILKETGTMVQDAKLADPLLSGHTRRILTAVAYYIKASSLDRPLSMYDVEEMFGVSDSAFRKCYRRMARALGVAEATYVHKRTRNKYDLYAEILMNQRSTITQLVKKTHVSFGELNNHVVLLTKRGLITCRAGTAKTYHLTEKGYAYLKLYGELKSFFGDSGKA